MPTADDARFAILASFLLALIEKSRSAG